MPDIFIDNASKDNKETIDSTKTNQAEQVPQVPAENKEPQQLDAETLNQEKAEIDPTENEEVNTPDGTLPKSELLESLGIRSHKGGMHALSSYFEDPSRIKFTNMLEEEILLLFLRRHFITNIPWIIKAIALALIPIVFEFLSSFGFYSSNFVAPEGKLVIYFFYYFFILSGYIFVNYMTWFYNISLVTSVRIVDIEFSQIVFENVAATKLSQLEDVKYSQIGFARSIFDYGDVFAETAGTASNFEFNAVPHPENVIRIINSLIGKPHD
jgi:hypothetical protein